MDINSLSSAASTLNKPDVVQQTPQVDKVEQLKPSVVSPAQDIDKSIEKVSQEQVDQVNSKLEQLGIGMAFSVDENTQSSVVKVVDKTTDEVIKQFPSEGSLRIMKNIQEYLNSVQNGIDPSKQGLTGTLLSEII